ncbi:LysR substrate-binding domain-containing protein [Stenotrophomonas sp.]|uniref:LysR substrate-binding domain-containing protein n=1 Tax=Stenotrophomonas sp. TaxID=69392 RepID=UPI0028B1F89A|nr:LysR substrate-binding domain-containing protein [Stenotrophomonas sp.]
MKSLPLNALRAFALVCAQGGVRAAARELGVSHSSVSRHLAELEAWMGAPLFERGTRTWTPTPHGAALGQRLLLQLQDMVDATAAARETQSLFSVTISVAPSFAARWLLPRLPALERAHPRIALSVLVNQRLDALADGVDLAVRMGTGPWPGLECEPLMDEVLFPVASPGFCQAMDVGTDPVCLHALRLLHDRDPAASWRRWSDVHGPAGLQVTDGPRLASSDLVLRGAELGQGVALARGRLAADALAGGALVRPFGQHEVRLANAYWIVRPPRSTANASRRHAVATVIAWLREQAG